MRVRVGIAQVNPTAGDLEGNADLVRTAVSRASADGCHLVILPHFALSGYPLGSLWERKDFLQAVDRTLEKLAADVSGCAVLLGTPELSRRKVYGSAALLHETRVAARFRMTRDEIAALAVPAEAARLSPGRGANAFSLGGVCTRVVFDPDRAAPGKGMTACLSASPYALELSRPSPCGEGPLLVSNLVGAQDGVVFYGASTARNAAGNVTAGCRAFDEDFCVADVDPEQGDTEGLYEVPVRGGAGHPPDAKTLEVMSKDEEIYKSLLVGLRDFVRKNGFETVLVGASGGIDSSFVLAVAVDALGPENVTAVTMPSSVTSKETRHDAAALAANLGCRLLHIDIAESASLLEAAVPGTSAHRIARENLQARIRGVILMTLANVNSSMVIATGNRSEAQTGYCTLYGDTVGGYAAIGDVPKTKIYDLAALINRRKEVIPPTIIRRTPSAELSPGQTDQDTLPPYPVLDEILKGILDRGSSPETLSKAGFDPATVTKVAGMMRASRFKREQLPPATLIHRAAIARHVPAPITNRF